MAIPANLSRAKSRRAGMVQKLTQIGQNSRIFDCFRGFLAFFRKFSHVSAPFVTRPLPLLSAEFRCRCKALAWSRPPGVLEYFEDLGHAGQRRRCPKEPLKKDTGHQNQSNTGGSPPNPGFLGTILILFYISIYVFPLPKNTRIFDTNAQVRPLWGASFSDTPNKSIEI